MNFSKKELSIFIEIVFSILFAIFFLPNFYENRLGTYDFNSTIKYIIQIVIFSIIYFSLAYTILEIFIKRKLINDERDVLIDLKSYKLGYILYEISLFSFIGVILSVAIFDSQMYQNNGGLVFMIIVWLLIVSFIKSVYQLYLYRTS
jgi:sterol desaturase/sphingolipid hydroxylase (fatty acid hydroxylase superfamily)|tara:strand:- start:785 stop:1225 length:441 start_codon:yes stop_codon:yes gene_type:complete